MGLFYKVIAKECRDTECEEFQKQKPGSSPGVCEGCGGPMFEVKKSNLPAIVITLLLLVAIIGGGGYFGLKIWAYRTTVKAFKQALEIGDQYVLDELFTKLQDMKGLEKCPECVDEYENFLTGKFEEALEKSDVPEAKTILAKIRVLENPNLCPDCEQKVTELEEATGYQQKLVLQSVPAEEYQFSDYLKRYLGYLETDSIKIDKAFEIQAGEVTVAEFRRYVETLDEAGKQTLETRWEKDSEGKLYADNRPVENISWQEAADYAKWLSEKTKWNLQLPTQQQWAAACVKHPDPQPVLGRNDDKPNEPLVVFRKGRDIDHLLGNLREWSADSCGDGKYSLLGENYMTDPTDPDAVGQANCAKDGKWAGVGFRLVKIGN